MTILFADFGLNSKKSSDVRNKSLSTLSLYSVGIRLHFLSIRIR